MTDSARASHTGRELLLLGFHTHHRGKRAPATPPRLNAGFQGARQGWVPARRGHTLRADAPFLEREDRTPHAGLRWSPQEQDPGTSFLSENPEDRSVCVWEGLVTQSEADSPDRPPRRGPAVQTAEWAVRRSDPTHPGAGRRRGLQLDHHQQQVPGESVSSCLGFPFVKWGE